MSVDINELVNRLERFNSAYRAGTPEIDDTAYDSLVEMLRLLDADHPYLNAVEPEALSSGHSVTHKRAMLSTEKAYDNDALSRFVERVEKAAAEIGATGIGFRVTPKLDGIAGNDDENILASRGNGRVGNDITHIFSRGVRVLGERNLGAGEVVMVESYFKEHFAEEFKHPRNMVVGIVNADEINPSARCALIEGQVHFVPYANLANWEGTGAELVARIDEITAELTAQVDYPLDGMVAETTHSEVKRYMGATSHHHRWQIAIKNRGETAETIIESIGWQTGRTGTVTPVLRVEPTMVSGATISNVTAHHAGMIRDKRLGVGARIEIIRSGEVIPKLERVLQEAEQVVLIENCPSCQTPLVWDNDFLRCTNHGACSAQTQTGIFYWFKTLGSADGFGPKSIEKLTDGGYTTLEEMYALTVEQLTPLGFGDKQAENLVASLETSRQTNVEDARFLSAFGIPNLGIGDSRKLLVHHRLRELENITTEQISAIKGFGDKTSGGIARALHTRWPTIAHMLALGFNLEETPLLSEQAEIASPVSGRVVMFTGKMIQGNRSDMQAQARALGATVLSAVSSKLEILVAGEKASGGKIDKARGFGAEVLSESEWIERIQEA